LKADLTHLAPSEELSPSILGRKYDAIILSDFSADHVSSEAQRRIIKQVEQRTGLLMIGGWGSFSGPYGGWRGSLLEGILPVTCLGRDDRMNFPSGALMVVKDRLPMFGTLSFDSTPVICGLNELRPKKKSRVLLTVRKIANKGNPASRGFRLSLDPKEYPFLVVDADPRKRVAALATDLAPHWCGGLLDWGKKHKILPVSDKIKIEVGERYIQFVASLIRWLAGAKA
jgi:uncharacterized membrane protein